MVWPSAKRTGLCLFGKLLSQLLFLFTLSKGRCCLFRALLSKFLWYLIEGFLAIGFALQKSDWIISTVHLFIVLVLLLSSTKCEPLVNIMLDITFMTVMLVTILMMMTILVMMIILVMISTINFTTSSTNGKRVCSTQLRNNCLGGFKVGGNCNNQQVVLKIIKCELRKLMMVEDDHGNDDHDDADIYIMMQFCLSVTTNDHSLLGVSSNHLNHP